MWASSHANGSGIPRLVCLLYVVHKSKTMRICPEIHTYKQQADIEINLRVSSRSRGHWELKLGPKVHCYLGQMWKLPETCGISTTISHVVTIVTYPGHQLKIELIGVWQQPSWHRPVMSNPLPAGCPGYYPQGWTC